MNETDATKSSPPADATAPEGSSPQQVGARGSQNGEVPIIQGWVRGAISVFILFHLIAIVCWAFPFNIRPIQDVRELVRPYMIWSGLFQSWDTFAPNPKSVNSWVEAVVITQNHRQKVWVFPRMEQLSFSERYLRERYRKFEEVMPQPSNALLWPGVARHITRIFDDPADPPEMVLLIEFLAPIRPGENKPETPKPTLFYEYVNFAPSGNSQ